MFNYWWKKISLKKFASLQKKILSLQKKNNLLSEEELKKKVNFLRQNLRGADEKKLNKYLVQVFALVREVIFRKTGLLLFPTQIFGAIVLHYGNVAQMNTGEGKTLTAFLPTCLNALTGNPVYVVTVNEYLAYRDWQLAKPILDFLQITSGANYTKLNSEEKRNLYNDCEVVYTTASELGFDYLRNNLVSKLEDKINLRFSYLLMDEVDSLAIDEAQNPLIISQRLDNQENIKQINYEKANQLAQNLIKKEEYKVNEKEKELWLKPKGIKHAEEFFQINNLFSFAHQENNFLLHNALKAKHFYLKDIEYIVDEQAQRIVIIDPLTGRLVPNRVYSAGIQQALECKEKLPINPQNKATATITYQNFFRLFKKIAGMTGTAESETEEFRQVYGMEVIAIQPYKKLIRNDRGDLVFWDKKSKYQYIIKKIKKVHQTTKRPILVGSPSVEISEYLSELLTKENIPHNKLNAINHKEEAEIISQAGQLGRITISTNMAGRGTDIIPSEDSLKVGGLLVIIAERNFSRRIDRQYIGRAGRQGQPGESICCVSLEDDLIKNYVMNKEQIGRIFGSKSVKNTFQKPLRGRLFNMLIAEPQEILRNLHASGRQYTLNYDLLINNQRKAIYNYRNKILNSSSILKLISPQKRKAITYQEFSEREVQNYLKSKLVKEVDLAWANYLEAIERIRGLVNIRIYLPQDPQEAFFWESSSLFRSTIAHINNRIQEVLVDNLQKIKLEKENKSTPANQNNF